MFKPTQPMSRALRRLALTTKQVNGGYYKGNRTGSMGRHTKHGGYIIEWRKVRTYVAPPALSDCKLTPFVSKAASKRDGYQEYPGEDGQGPMSGERYLNRWKNENGAEGTY